MTQLSHRLLTSISLSSFPLLQEHEGATEPDHGAHFPRHAVRHAGLQVEQRRGQGPGGRSPGVIRGRSQDAAD